MAALREKKGKGRSESDSDCGMKERRERRAMELLPTRERRNGRRVVQKHEPRQLCQLRSRDLAETEGKSTAAFQTVSCKSH